MKKSFIVHSFIILLILILPNGCMNLPDEVIMPNWDVDLNIPIANKFYQLSDIIKPQQYISFDPSSAAGSIYLLQMDTYDLKAPVSNFIEIKNGTFSPDHIVRASDDSIIFFVLFPEGIELDSAVFVGGEIIYNIDNPSAVSVTAYLRIPGIIKPDGNEVVIQVIVQPSAQYSSTYNLAGHKYILPSNQPPILKNSLQVIPKVTSSVPSTYAIIDFGSSNFQFSSITGKIPEKSLGTKNIFAKLDLGSDVINFRDKLFLKEASLDLKADYTSPSSNPFEMELRNIRLIGVRGSGEQKILALNSGSNLTFKLEDGKYNTIFTELNSNIVEFITFLPDSIIINAEYILNPDNSNYSRTVTNLDSIKFETKFSTRGYLALKSTTIKDTVQIIISESDRNAMKNGKAANICLQIENAIPINSALKITLTDENYSPLFIITKKENGGDSILFSGAQVNASTGEVISSTPSTINLILNSDQIEMMSNARYVIISTTVQTTDAYENNPNPPLVAVKASDWITIKSFATIKYNLNPN